MKPTHLDAGFCADCVTPVCESQFGKTDVILHAFDWPYSDVTKRAEEIAKLGYKTVLVSPPMKSYACEEGTKWWQRYQPQDYRVIDNQLGNTTDFVTMVDTLSQLGVQVYADVVFNHMANETHLRKDLSYPNPSDIQFYRDNWEQMQQLRLFGDLSQSLFSHNDFEDAFGIEDWKDKWQVQNGRISSGESDPGLPTLKHNDNVVFNQQQYLNALKQIGVKGFRIDAAKHMTLEHLKSVWTEDIMQGVHIFGEIITDGGATVEEYELFLKPYLESTMLGAYDFPLFNIVHAVFSSDGDMTSLINPYTFGQALSSSRAITFAITHDIPNNDVFVDLVMEEQSEWLAYSYILGRDGGVPLIYTDLNTSGIMDKNGNARWLNTWKDPRMANMIAFHNYSHGKPMQKIAGDESYLIFSRGENGLVGINKSDTSIEVNIEWPKEMYDLLSGETISPESGVLNIILTPLSSRMMVEPY